MSNSTSFSPVRQCKNRDNCVHPDGPMLPISEFRKQGYIYSSHCNQCLDIHLAGNVVNPRNAKLFGESIELLAMGEMQKQGIFVTPGKASMFNHADIVAWNCIRIEVKASQPKRNQRWVFSFQSQMKTGLRAEFILLVPVGQGEPTFHLFPADHPVFYHDGRLQESVTYTPLARDTKWLYDKPRATTLRPHLTLELMEQHLNMWHMIEDRRLEIVDQIKNGVYHPD